MTYRQVLYRQVLYRQVLYGQVLYRLSVVQTYTLEANTHFKYLVEVDLENSPA